LIELEKTFGVSYPNSKLDIVAAAVVYNEEGWGLGSHIPSSILNNAIIRRLNDLVHNIVHQWFGNLVTIKWWDDIWLHESLVIFLSDLEAERIIPTEKLLQSSFIDILKSMHLDSQQTLPAISRDLNTPEEIQRRLFNSTLLTKGVSIVRMLRYILGKESFDKALTKYLTDFKYQSVDQYDFFNLLDKQGKQDGIRNLETVNLTAAMVQWTR